jgi:peptidylprolyl isomerase
MTIKKGDNVSVHYTGTLEDGTVFDSSKKHDQTLDFEVGSGQLIKGFDEALIGMKIGETKNVTLKPEEAYGEHNQQLIQEVPKEAAKNIPDPKEGMIIGLQGPQGQNLQATITKVEEETITFDLNHPLAGKTLNFEITVESVNN